MNNRFIAIRTCSLIGQQFDVPGILDTSNDTVCICSGYSSKVRDQIISDLKNDPSATISLHWRSGQTWEPDPVSPHNPSWWNIPDSIADVESISKFKL